MLFEDLRPDCHNYVFGDSMAPYPMKRASTVDARLIVSTVDHGPVSESILALETDADVILQANTSREARELLDAGATYVAVPSVLALDQLVKAVEQVLGDYRGGDCA